jgi:hypothetical protein
MGGGGAGGVTILRRERSGANVLSWSWDVDAPWSNLRMGEREDQGREDGDEYHIIAPATISPTL